MLRAIEPPRDPGIDGEAAWRRSLAEPHAVWNTGTGSEKFSASVLGRLADGYATPHIEPKFKLRADDAFFCIGSCFAREIERQLVYRAFNVTSAALELPAIDEGQPNPTSSVNKFTTASMLNELHWSLGGEPFPDEALVPDLAGYRDLQLAQAPVAVPLEVARERRARLLEYFGRMREATVVIVTLGLVELWYDRLTNLYLNITPTWEMVHRFPGRFTAHVTDYTDNAARLREMLDILAAQGRDDLRIVVTVSPVPLHRTFVGADVLVENAYSKATLRAVAGDVVRTRANVDYFPSYELVTVTDRNRAYAPDHIHITKDMGDQVARTFLNAFGIGRDDPNPEFSELDYLRANPDVRMAIAEGVCKSGYAHWVEHGRAERRPLRL